ncbi:MAG TPA: CBS domain-containing protein [Vicinamibacterales bacterium]|nr:CBS domain-containing protein [Vicinamibacterales bacterium]
MQVQQLMTPAPLSCSPDTDLSTAVELMWKGDFGVLPVTDDGGRVLGILTDRDICIALGTRDQAASRLKASDVMSGAVQTCRPDEEAQSALLAMRDMRVRRLPVVDAEGRLCGLFSINDAVLDADGGLAAADVVETLRAICEHRKPSGTPLVVAA